MEETKLVSVWGGKQLGKGVHLKVTLEGLLVENAVVQAGGALGEVRRPDFKHPYPSLSLSFCCNHHPKPQPPPNTTPDVPPPRVR